MPPLGANDRSIVSVTALGHALVHTYELSLPILMTIWLQELTTTRVELGLVVGLGYALFGAGALPGGVLTDRFGSRRLIVLCLAGMGTSFLLLSFSHTVWTIGGALVLWGAAASLYHPAGLSLISRGVLRRGAAFAYHGMAGNAGIALGPLFTALLLLFVDWQTATLLLAVPAGLGAVYAAGVRVDETAAEVTPDPQSDSHPDEKVGFWVRTRALAASAFPAVFAIAMLSGLYYRGVLTFLPDLFSAFPGFEPVAVGATTLEPARYVYAGILTVGMLGQYVGGWLTDRADLERSLAISFGVLALVAVLFLPAAGAGLLPLLLISALLGFFLFVVQPVYQALVAEYSPAEARGLSYGYAYLAVFGLGAAGAAISGFLIDRYGPATLFGALAGIAAVAAGISAWRALAGGSEDVPETARASVGTSEDPKS